jgi:hypothetical protein
MMNAFRVKQLIEEADTFYTLVSDVDFYGNNMLEVSDSPEVTVEWELVTDARSYGVKSFDIYIKRVNVNVTLSHVETGEETDFSLAWTPRDTAGWQVKVESDAPFLHSSIYPKKVELNTAQKVLTLIF